MKFNRHEIILRYRYVTTMSDAYKPMDQALTDWTTGKKWEYLWNGKLFILISPIYRIFESNDILVQLQIDVEGRYGGDFKELFYRCVRFVKKYPKTYFIYTGGGGYHIYSNYVFFIKDGLKKQIRDIRNAILSQYDLDIIGRSNIDFVGSIRDMPAARIGARPDTKKLAFPILKYDWNWFEYAHKINKYESFITTRQLKYYMKHQMIPVHTIKELPV